MGSLTESTLFRLICENLYSGVRFEHRFHHKRKWRFDVAWPDRMIAVEIDGGVWVSGRHSRGAGQVKDNEKINVALSLGWSVYRFTPGDVKSGYFQKAMEAVFIGEEMPHIVRRKRNDRKRNKGSTDTEGTKPRAVSKEGRSKPVNDVPSGTRKINPNRKSEGKDIGSAEGEREETV